MLQKLFLILFCFPIALFSTVYIQKPCHFDAKVEIVDCFLNYQDKILILHRQENKSQGNLWGIPGGKKEKDESLEQAIIREVFEETGFDISQQPIYFIGKVYIKYPNNFDYIYHMFKCTPTEKPETVKIQFDEHKGFSWVTPNDALKMDLMLDEETCFRLVYETSCGQ